MSTHAMALASRSGNRALPVPGLYSRALATAPFYDAGHSSSVEAARLRGMAAIADLVSLSALGAVVDTRGSVVADVGAGESTSLGVTLTVRNPSLTYLPVDVRAEAVDAQRRVRVRRAGWFGHRPAPGRWHG